MARTKWRCFHCGFVTTSPKYAEEHFGRTEMESPACKIAGSEEGLVGYIRRLEAEIWRFHNESHELLTAAYAIQFNARLIEPEAEQRGYDKGVSDTYDLLQKKEP